MSALTNTCRLSAALGLLLCSTVASADTQTFVEVQGSVGYSTNPFLRTGGDTGGGFGRISANAVHGWRSERSETTLSAYVENSSYFRRYSSQQVFSLNGSTSRRLSELLDVYGSVNFSRDVGNQLGTRFFGVPTLDTDLPDPLQPPESVIILDPRLASLSRRVYRLGSNVGGTLTLSPRDSLTASFGAQRISVSGGISELDSKLYNGTLAYNRQLSERVRVGGRIIADHGDYETGQSVTTFGPQFTFGARLNQEWEVSGGVGFVRSTFKDSLTGFRDTSNSLAIDGSLCRAFADDRFCASLSRRAQGGVVGGAPATSASLSYSRRLSVRDDVQIRGSLARAGASPIRGGVQQSSFYDLGGSYNRSFSPRFSGGVNLFGRKGSLSGVDVKNDLGGSVFLRYRFGDLR